jgi:hypothetical protein
MTIRLSDEVVVERPFTETDIGGTNTAGSDDALHWTSMVGFSRVLVAVELGTWNATDDLDTAKIQQASDSAGTGIKDLTSSSSTGNYDTDNPLDADGDKLFFNVRAEDLDAANGFTHIRFYGAETGNTGVDNISCVYIKDPVNAHGEINGAPSTGVLKYIDVDSQV